MGERAEQILGEARIDLGDERLERRLRALVEALAEQPESSLAQACGGWAAQQAAYRFFRNEAVRPEALAAVLGEATVARCAGEARVVVIQDTTSLDYTAHPATTGLGALEQPSRRGLLLHTAQAVSVAGVPLGLLDLQLWARADEPDPSGERRHQRPLEAKESAKWVRGLRRTAERLAGTARPLTIADREADIYALFMLAHELDGDWLIRARHDRALAGDEGRLLATVERAPVCARLTTEVPRAGTRPARTAELVVRAVTVTLVPPRPRSGAVAQWWARHPAAEHLGPTQLRPLQVGVVLVTEPAPPADEAPLRWLLLTSLPTETPEQALACVGLYRLRWLAERFHFVLKSGCRVERLQLEDGARLERAVAVYAAVAWWLLWLTEQARATPDAPCTVVLEAAAWQALYAYTHRTLVLPATPPDLRTAVRLLASLGGFRGRKGDGEPGVQVLWRGVRRLHDIVETWTLFHSLPPPHGHPRYVQR